MEVERLIQKAEELARKYDIRYYEVRIAKINATSLAMQNSQLEELSSN